MGELGGAVQSWLANKKISHTHMHRILASPVQSPQHAPSLIWMITNLYPLVIPKLCALFRGPQLFILSKSYSVYKNLVLW